MNNAKINYAFRSRLNPGSRLYFFLLPLLVIGCRVGKPLPTPIPQLPEKFQSVSHEDSVSIADLSWQTFFTDPNLQGLIAKGIANNHELLFAVRNIDISDRQLAQARTLQLPEVRLQISAQTSRPSDNSLNAATIKNYLGKTHVENYSTAVTATWEADIWGKIRAQKEMALGSYLQSYEARAAVQTGLVANIAHGYFNLLMLDREMVIARANLILTDSFVIATRLLKDAGLANALAVHQAEAQQQSTALLIPQLEEAIALQENALQLLTGQLPGRIARRAPSAIDDDFISALSTGLPAAMVRRRPDVRQGELALVIASAEVGVAQANMYPALNLTAGVGLEAFKASNWWNIPNSLFGLAAGAIAQPLLQHRALRTAFEVAQLRREQTVIRFKESVLRAVVEVSDALVQLEKTKQQEQLAAARVATLQLAVSNARQLFKSDMASYLEVISAQANALQAQLDYSILQRQQADAVIELYRALGGGWK